MHEQVIMNGGMNGGSNGIPSTGGGGCNTLSNNNGLIVSNGINGCNGKAIMSSTDIESSTGATHSPICQFLTGKSVFITGASGFVGKVLITKLLKECPMIGTIYVLLRPKSGQDCRARLEELLNSIVFEPLRSNISQQQWSSLAAKLVPIPGDVTFPGLGISQADLLKLRDHVTIVFHSAATVRFDEPIKRAVKINVFGTHQVIELCHKLRHLEALVHVSTAYCNVNKKDVDESVVMEAIAPEKIIEVTEWMDDDLLNSLSPTLLAGRPSSYHYTKALAENLMAQEGNNLPIAIIRPSIITAALKDPLPGWIDNYNGPTGYLVVAGKGVLRSMLVDGDKICDMIPVDVVVNTMIAGAWFIGTKRPSSALVVNCTSGGLNPITWGEVKETSAPYLIKHPSMEIFRYPGAKFVSNRLIHSLFVQVEHSIPAALIDFLFKITGHRPILAPVYQKVHRSMAALEIFTTNEWTFRNNNFLMLMNELSASSDAQNFTIDIRKVNWTRYMEIYVLGVRNYLLKEDPSTIPEARKRLQRSNRKALNTPPQINR